jgi:hypothetical protein
VTGNNLVSQWGLKPVDRTTLTTEQQAEIMHKEMTPTEEELDKAAHNRPETDIESPLEQWTEGQEAPPQTGVVIHSVTISTNFLSGGSMSSKILDEILKDGEQALSLLAGFAPAIMQIFEPKSSATPIVTALAPLIPQAMAAAQQFGIGGTQAAGAQMAAAASSLLGVAVQAGTVLSKGGQAHTMDELAQAQPVINQIFTGIINAATAGATAAANVAATTAAAAG